MSIKVKGEAIKEGSIPFSALSDEIKNKLSNDKYKKLDWYYNSDAGGYAAESQTNKIIINEKEYILTDETAGIPVNNKEYGFTYNSYNDIYYVIVYGADEEDVDILTNNVFILNETSSAAVPDWNAQKDEAGYIKNSLFKIRHGDLGEEVTKELLEQYKLNLDEFEYYEKVDDSGEVFPCLRKEVEAPGFVNQILHNVHNVGAGYVSKGSFILQNSKQIYFGDYGAITFTEDYTDDKVYMMINYEYDYTMNEVPNFDIYIIPDWDPFFMEPLSEELLPKTLVKTTAQYLSSTEKNQALANLGIDPVVWKYMCNPIIICTGDPVPNDILLNGKLKPMPTCCYYVMDIINDYPGIVLKPSDDEGQLLVAHNKTLYYYYADADGNWGMMEY